MAVLTGGVPGLKTRSVQGSVVGALVDLAAHPRGGSHPYVTLLSWDLTFYSDLLGIKHVRGANTYVQAKYPDRNMIKSN